jgi:hypothetical protein
MIDCTSATRAEMTAEIVRLENLCEAAQREVANIRCDSEIIEIAVRDYRYVVRKALAIGDDLKYTDQELQDLIGKSYRTLAYNYKVALAGLRIETKKNELRLQGKLW